MAKTPKPGPLTGPKADRHKSGLMIRLPESARPILAALKAKNRRPTTTEVLIALEHHAKAEGVKLPATQ